MFLENVIGSLTGDKKIYEDAKRQNELNQIEVENSTKEYSQTEIILSEEARQLDNVKEKILVEFERIDNDIKNNLHETEIARREIQQANEIDISDGVITAGVASGSLAAGSALALVRAFCMAGTGTAISNLSGAFAIRATLAALGGGTLATGGFGIIGGIVVTSTLFVVPAVIVSGVMVHKKVKKFVEQVKTSTKKVQAIIKSNSELAERNLKAAAKFRKMYDVGISINFLLKNLQYRIEHAPAKIQSDMRKIANAARDSLVKAFMDFEILTEDNQEFNSAFDNILRSIEDDCQSLQNILYENHGKIYTSRNINPIFKQIYSDAQNFIYMSYPWFNLYCAKADLPLIKAALERGVKIFIYYGYGRNASDAIYQKTVAAIDFMKNNLPNDGVEFFHVNSHRKIILCERYVLYGSQNMMTYRYDEYAKRIGDLREEVTTKVENIDMVNEFKNLIISQTAN